MTWLNVSPEVFAQAILMNSGNVDDGVHWLLFNKTASGWTKDHVLSRFRLFHAGASIPLSQ